MDIGIHSESIDMSTRNGTSNGESAGCIWVCQIAMIEGVVGVLGNLLVCFTILRVKFLHSMTNYLLVNLAVADLLGCLQAFFYYLSADQHFVLVRYIPASPVGKELFCRTLASAFLFWFLSNTSAYTLCLVTLERYVALLHPLHYETKLTAKRMKMLVAVTWAVSFLFALPVLFTNKPTDNADSACSYDENPDLARASHVVSFFSGYALPITLMGTAYYKMQVALKRQAQALHLQHAKAAAYDLVIARQRLVSMLTLVLGALVILWTPIFIISNVCVYGQDGARCSSKGYRGASDFGNFLYYFNSVINPILYGFKYKRFRQALKAVLSGCFSKRDNRNRVDVEMIAH